MKIVSLLVSIGIAQLAGVIGSIFTANTVKTWFLDLTKPVWNPPSWLFGPVWITLYTLMGIAAYIIWQNRGDFDIKLAISFYGGQLVLNTLWSIIFFGLKNPGLAFMEIIVLLVLILITTILFWRINTVAGALMIPYILWVLFAAFLNYNIWQLN